MKRREIAPQRIAIALILFIPLMILPFAAAGCGEQMTRMEDNQVTLQAMVAANARQLATISSQIHVNNADLQEGMQDLDQNDQSLAVQVTTVQDKQAQLHNTITSGDQALGRRMVALEENQQLLQDGVVQVADVTQRTAADVAAVAKEHATLHRLVQNNKQELARNIATVANNQKTTQTGIGHLQQADRNMTEQLVTLANEQQTLHAMVESDNAELDNRIASLGAHQNQLDAQLGNLHTLTDKVMSRANGIAEGQTALHAAAQSQTQSLAERITVVTQNQENLRALVNEVSNTATQTAGNVTVLTTSQEDIHKTLGTNQKIVTGQVAAVIENQQSVQTSINDLHQKADLTTASLDELSSGQNVLHQSITANATTLNTRMGALAENQRAIRTGISDLSDTTDRMAAGQDALRHSVQSQAETVTAQMSTLTNNQQDLQNHLDTVTATAGQMTLDLLAMDNQQARQHEAVRTGINTLDQKTSEVAANLNTVAAGQASLHENVKTVRNEIGTQTATLTENQRSLQNGIELLDTKTTQAVTDLTAVATTQQTLQQTVEGNDRAVQGQMKKLADNQHALQSGLDTVTATTGQTALNVLAVGDGQARLEQNLQAGINDLAGKTNDLASNVDAMTAEQASLRKSFEVAGGNLNTQVAKLADNQQTLQAGVSSLHKQTDRIADDVGTAASGQDALLQAIASHNDTTAHQFAQLAEGQGGLQDHLDIVTATAGQTALDLNAMGQTQTRLEQNVAANLNALNQQAGQMTTDLQTVSSTQKELQNSLKHHDQSVAEQMAGVVKGQQQIHTGLDTATATAGQTALDVIAVASKQQTLERSLQSHNEAVANQLSGLDNMQESMQAGLDTVTATTGQVALDLIAVGQEQAKLAKAAQADRQQVTARLAELAQDRQQWSQRLDTAQTGMETMADSILALEQRLASLQGTMHESMDGVATLLDADGNHRLQFETQLRQELQSMMESVARLRETQTSLQTQMQQIQNTTQGQTDDILSAIEQLQRKPSELRLSDAGVPVEPSLTETDN